METACLRIKFKPLIQKKTINNSKCCLEIVPEISSIKNLDKIVWRKKNNLIEYTIPIAMTYKVVLQKQQAIQDDSDIAIKTYHSCVDLLLPSSNAMLGGPGSGDIPKIISDTYILKKISLENCASKEHLFGYTNGRTHSDNDMIIPIFDDTTKTLLQLREPERKDTQINNTDDTAEDKLNKRKKNVNVDLYEESLHKITNTEDLYPVFSDTVLSGTVVRETVKTKTSFKRESERWLSLSPICSVIAGGTPLASKIVSSKSVTCKIYESRRDLVLLGSIGSPSALSPDNQTLSTIGDISRQNSPNKLRVLCRIPPEMRVVEYMRFIENEMLPLKMWLNDIIRKCTVLGIELRKAPSKQTMAVATQSIYEENNSVKSNRVVYSFVFDG